MDFDPSQIPAVLSLLFTGATFGGVVKVVRWTADHDSRLASVEKDLQRHVDSDKVTHADLAEKQADLHAESERWSRRVVAAERDIAYLSGPRQGFGPNPRRDVSDESGPQEANIRRGKI